MTNVSEINTRFGVPGVVSIEAGNNNMPRVRVANAEAEAEVYLHGAHVTHFQPRGHKPVLFMSGESLFDPAKPIRGGVPLIFPWFGPNASNPKAPQHGFARTTQWTVRDVQQGRDGPTTIVLGLRTPQAPPPPHGQSACTPPLRNLAIPPAPRLPRGVPHPRRPLARQVAGDRQRVARRD